ncbi:MAG: peptidylprolyl isomerase [Actinomycetota bacterium]
MSRISSRTRLVAAIVALVLFAAACGDDEPIATVDGGESLTQGDLVDVIASIGTSELEADDISTVDKAEAANVITEWARNELFYAEMAERGYEIDEALFDTSRAQLEEFRLQGSLVADPDSFDYEIQVRANALAPAVADFLETFGAEPVWPFQLCSSHILVETEAEAEAVIARLDQGEDFAALAMELSTGPSGPGGGDLGCVDPASFVPEFIAGAEATEIGGVSAPTETQFGWHVILVRSFGADPSDDPAAIEAALFGSTLFTELQDAAVSRAVDVDDEYGVWDLATLSVVAN